MSLPLLRLLSTCADALAFRGCSDVPLWARRMAILRCAGEAMAHQDAMTEMDLPAPDRTGEPLTVTARACGASPWRGDREIGPAEYRRLERACVDATIGIAGLSTQYRAARIAGLIVDSSDVDESFATHA